MDDDEFGDLYTDVLRPLFAQFQPHREESEAAAAVGNALPIDLNFNIDDEEILYGTPDKKNQNQSLNPKPVPNLYLVPGWNLNATAQEKNLAQPRGFNLNLGSNSEVEMVDGLVGKGVEGWRLETHILEKGEGVKIPLKASGASYFLEEDADDINIVLEDGEDKDVDSFRKEDNFGDKEDAAAKRRIFPVLQIRASWVKK